MSTKPAKAPLIPFSTAIGLIVAITLAAVLCQTFGSDSLQRAGAQMFVSMIAVIGLHVFIGNSGVASFGHAAFLAIGAYTVAATRIPGMTKDVMLPDLPGPELDAVSAALIGGVAAALVAFVFGVVLMRLTGLAAGLSTFALLSIVYVIASNTRTVTGGVSGVFGVPQTTTVMSGLVWAIGAILCAWAFAQTKLCLRLRATREDETAAQSIGIGVLWERVAAFTLSAFLTGVAGGLLAMYLGSFNPDAFYLSITLLTLAMLVVGGASSLSGAVIGTVVISILRELLRSVERGMSIGSFSIPTFNGLQELGTAVALLAILLLRPAGLTLGKELFRQLPRRPAPGKKPPRKAEKVVERDTVKMEAGA